MRKPMTKKQITWFHRSIARVVAFLLCLALAGCASMIGSIVYGTIINSRLPLYNARIYSVRPSYHILWVSKRGRATKHSRIRTPLRTIATGRYRNWDWTVQGTDVVASSWRFWLSGSGGKHKPVIWSSAIVGNGLQRIHAWQYGFERLWKVTRYLLDTSPLPMKITVILLPHGMPYHLSVITRGRTRIALPLVAWYPISRSDARATSAKQFRAYMKTLGEVGGQLERVELATGHTAAPRHGRGRLIKDLANATCFRVSTELALAAGTTFKVPNPVAAGAGKGGVDKIIASLYKEHPQSLAVQEIYAVILLVHGIKEYQAYEGQSWPQDGRNLHEINALLGYCHAFVHYRGDIRTRTLPGVEVSPAHFFVP